MEGIADLLFGSPPAAGILAEVAAMRASVEAAAPPGCLKSGRGGMQDAEFAAQGLVLAHGHALPGVRRSNTVDALSSLREAGVLSAADQEDLVTALLFLRSVELRLRLVSGEGGSVLPADAGPLARRLGYVDTSFAPAGRSLAEEVGFYRERMRRAFGRVAG
jgi:glutamate-ammonia-ligase adenylyltransferase